MMQQIVTHVGKQVIKHWSLMTIVSCALQLPPEMNGVITAVRKVHTCVDSLVLIVSNIVFGLILVLTFIVCRFRI